MVTACGEQWLSISRCARLCECEVWWRDMCRRKNARLWFSCIHQKNAFFCCGCVFHKSDLINQQQEQGTNKSIFRVTKKNIIFCIFFSCQFHIFIVYFTVGIKVNAMDWSRQTSTNQRKTLILSRTRKHLLIIFVFVMKIVPYSLLKSWTNLYLTYYESLLRISMVSTVRCDKIDMMQLLQ